MNTGKNPLENKEFLSRLIFLEGKLMSDNYDYSVVEELIIIYTVILFILFYIPSKFPVPSAIFGTVNLKSLFLIIIRNW